MRTTRTRALVAVTALGMLAAMPGLAGTAGARVVSTNTKFCAVFGAQMPAIDFEGLGVEEATVGAKLFRDAAKTGLPAKLKQDMKKVAKIYGRIAKGEPASEVLDADQQAAILPSLVRFSKYYATNCVAATPSS
jgi:hypothetical protein